MANQPARLATGGWAVGVGGLSGGRLGVAAGSTAGACVVTARARPRWQRGGRAGARGKKIRFSFAVGKSTCQFSYAAGADRAVAVPSRPEPPKTVVVALWQSRVFRGADRRHPRERPHIAAPGSRQ